MDTTGFEPELTPPDDKHFTRREQGVGVRPTASGHSPGWAEGLGLGIVEHSITLFSRNQHFAVVQEGGLSFADKGQHAGKERERAGGGIVELRGTETFVVLPGLV
jgi:hypothetical protein